MRGKDDIANMSLSRSKELMIEYNKTRDPEIFSLLLAKFDKYLISLVHKFRRRYYVLEGEDLQELYHIAVLGFHKAMLGIKEKHRPEYIFLFILAFVKYELRTSYEYKNKEVPYDRSLHTSRELDDGGLARRLNDQLTEFDLRLMHAVLKKGPLTKRDKEIVKLRFKQGLTYKEIGKELKIASVTAWNRADQLMVKIKSLFSKDINM